MLLTLEAVGTECFLICSKSRVGGLLQSRIGVSNIGPTILFEDWVQIVRTYVLKEAGS